MSDLVGRLIAGKYRVTRRLGGGGVADVFEAVHEEIGQRFAIKVLKREFAAYAEVADRFLTEARAASAVRHPGVVQIFDLGRLEEGEPYLVMELLEGENLAELLHRQGKLPQEQAVGLCLHVLDALDAAHRAGVIHRDLKTENVVLVRGPGGEPWAKLIDFGIARLAQEGPAALRRTAQGTVMGTPYYMSPEQARSVPTIDGRADLYAAGVMLYEMVTGQVPFDGVSPSEILTRALTEPFPSVRTLEPSAGQALDDVIQRATQRKREQRFQSAAEFVEALRPLRPELVAVQVLPEGDEADLESTGLRRLQELAARTPSWRPAGLTPPRLSMPGRLSTPPLPPGRAGRSPSPPDGTPAVMHRRSLTPPPTRPSLPSMELPRNTLIVSRWAVFIGATIGVAAVAAGLGALLVVLSDRGSGPSDAALAAGDYVTAARPVASPDLTPIAERSSAAVVPALTGAHDLAAASAAVGAPPARSAPPAEPQAVAPQAPVAAPAEPPAPPAAATIRLTGLPAGARATLDGAPVGAEFSLEVSHESHTLRVVARGRRPFVHAFQATGDTTIRVVLERADGAIRRPTGQAPAATPGGGEPAGTPRPLANPFGNP